MKYEIKRFEYFPVFKLVITVCLVVGIIFGIILGALLGAGIGSFSQYYDLGRIGLGGAGAALGVIMGVVFGIIWAILAGIVSILYVFIYNLAAGLVGGIEVELKGEKLSRICPSYGYTLAKDAAFCPNCGKKVGL